MTNKLLHDKYSNQLYLVRSIFCIMMELSHIKQWTKKKCGLVSVEPMLLGYLAAASMVSNIRPDFFLDRVCKNTYSQNQSICESKYNDTIKHQVESKVSFYMLVHKYTLSKLYVSHFKRCHEI